MKLKDAIEMNERSDEAELKGHLKYLGIRLGEILLTPEMLESRDWGYVIENSDPEFAKALGGLVERLKEDGPMISVKEGLRLVD